MKQKRIILYRVWLCMAMMLATALGVNAQGKITLKLTDEPLPKALRLIEQQGSKSIIFSVSETEKYKVSADIRDTTQTGAINHVLWGKPFVAKERPEYFVVQKQESKTTAVGISGVVVDEKGEPMSYCNVLLLDADSTYISGVATDTEGSFYLPLKGDEEYTLQVSYVGYEPLLVEVKESPITITMKPIIMDEVVVVGRKRLYTLNNGEMVATVKGTILENFATADDVIAQLPFISGQNGDFTVFGKGTPLIYINNRLVRDSEELKRLMSSDIKSIKVNMVPGAKYDASVSAVIQIITERPQGEGLSGSLYAGSRRSRVWSAEEYASLNYRNDVWDIFGSAYYIQDREHIGLESHQQLMMAGTSHDVTYDGEERIKSDRLATVAGINYNPNPNHSAGMQYVYDNSQWRDDMFNHILYTADGHTETMGQSSYFDKPSKSHDVNAYYSGMWNNKFSFNFNADWATGNETDGMNSFFVDKYAEDINTLGTRRYDLYAAKGVFSYTNNQWLTLDAGTEYSYTDVAQTYDIDDKELGIDNSNDMTRQNRWAMFVSAKAQAGKWGFGAGLRYENIDFAYYQNQVYNKQQSKVYSELFPNVQASYSNNDFNAVMGYERKIKYPSYWQLRSNIQYSSPFIYESGNPLLQPQIQNSLTGMLAYKDVKVMLGHNIYEGYITQLAHLYEDEPVVHLHTANVENVKSSFFTIGYTPTVGIWRPNLEAGGQFQSFTLGDGKNYNKPLFNTRWNNYFSLPKDWMIRVDARWQSAGNVGVRLIGSSWKMNAGVTKRFLDSKLSLSLTLNNIFNTEKSQWLIQDDCLTFDYDRYSDSRYVELTVSYDFNTTRSKYKGTGAGQSEKQRL